jgi:hypothetical protein
MLDDRHPGGGPTQPGGSELLMVWGVVLAAA